MVEEYIPKGYENRVSREYLNTVLHIKDRVIRRDIATSDEVIIHDDGYFIPEGPEDLEHIEHYILRETARAAAIHERVEKARELYFSIKEKE